MYADWEVKNREFAEEELLTKLERMPSGKLGIK